MNGHERTGGIVGYHQVQFCMGSVISACCSQLSQPYLGMAHHQHMSDDMCLTPDNIMMFSDDAKTQRDAKTMCQYY